MEDRSYYLTVGEDPHGRGLIAVMSLGSPQHGDEQCVLLTMEIVKTMREAKSWFRRMKIEKPWVSGNRMARFSNDTNFILWAAAIGAFVLFIADLAAKVWTLAKAWF